MLTRADFQDFTLLRHGSRSAIYAGTLSADGRAVILKVLESDGAPLEQIARLENEYRLSQDLELPCFRRALELVRFEDRPGLLLEDPGGVPLRDWSRSLQVRNRKDLLAVLRVGIAIADALAELHDREIIHKDINSNNILVVGPAPGDSISGWSEACGEEQAARIVLIDFGLSTRIEHKKQFLENPGRLEGTLGFISPEQTGRMNRTIDHRSDLYSLGVTLFEMFTGRLPFETEDPMELVHAHIARTPPPAHEFNDALPPVLSSIVARLLAKNAEERYQSARGPGDDLRTLLEICQQTEPGAKIESFVPGRGDHTSRLRISERLYGREKQLAELSSAYDRICRGERGLFAIGGAGGIGKSALVREIYRELKLSDAARSFFISGKFDQLKRNVPYLAWSQTLADLAAQLLGTGDEELAEWKERIRTALGANAGVLTALAGELELLTGPVAELPVLEGAEARNRLHYTFRTFFRAICSERNPIVFSIDDLQWADLGSLELLEVLLSDTENDHMLVIGAFRSDEVDASHPLSATLNRLDAADLLLSRVELQALTTDAVRDLLCDSLHMDAALIASLGEQLHRKTHGNAFFLIQFLKELNAAGDLTYDPERKIWRWDQEKIRAAASTGNVVELLSEQVRRLPPATRELLEVAACAGDSSTLRVLSVVAEMEPLQVLSELRPALESGFLFALGADARLAEMGSAGEAEADLTRRLLDGDFYFKFAHDRVQQAAYFYIAEDRRLRIHESLGRLLLSLAPIARAATAAEFLALADEKVFEIVGHLGRAAGALATSDRRQLAGLNLAAAERARESAAFLSSGQYYQAAVDLLGEDAWQNEYDLALALHGGGARAAAFMLDFETTERLAAVVQKQARTAMDTVIAEEAGIAALIARSQPTDALDRARKLLRRLGIRLPRRAKKIHVLLELLKSRLQMLGSNREKLRALPEMPAGRLKAAMQIMSAITSAAYTSETDLLPVLAIKQTAISWRHGLASESTFAFGTYGMILSGPLGRLEQGYDFGALAVELAETRPEYAGRTETIFQTFLNHWRTPIRDTVQPLLNAHHRCLEVGDHEYAAVAAFVYGQHRFLAGEKLERAQESLKRYTEIIQEMGQGDRVPYTYIYIQLIQNLITPVEQPESLRGDAFNPDSVGEHDRVSRFTLAISRLILHGYFDRPRGALDLIPEVARNSAVNSPMVAYFRFFSGLARVDAYRAGLAGGRALLKAARKDLRKLQPFAESSPVNYGCFYTLLAAELDDCYGRTSAARDGYDAAIDRGAGSGHPGHEGLAAARAAAFHRRARRFRLARYYLGLALRLYRIWGANALVADLERRFGRETEAGPGAGTSTTTEVSGRNLDSSTSTTMTLPVSVTRAGDEHALDMASIVKSTQALSGEIFIEDLLKKLMALTIENAGANLGYLVLQRNGNWTVEARASLETGIEITSGTPLANTGDAQGPALTVINYARRSQKNVVLNNVLEDDRFSSDPRVRSGQTRAVLCMPILSRGKMTGILYLENTHVPGAFTPDRLEVLNLIASQAGISIENSRFLNDMYELNRAYERFVPRQFLEIMGKESIVEITPGSFARREMSILFCDIRQFTTLSETMTPQETFDFINSYLAHMEPIITACGGFIDKYIGDAIMALFPGPPDGAISAGASMLSRLWEFNMEREVSDLPPIRIGIGVNTGTLMLGTIGGDTRMDGTVIGDAVNQAARIESITKRYGVPFILSQETYDSLEHPEAFHIRALDRVKLRGKQEAVQLYECFDIDDQDLRAAKKSTEAELKRGRALLGGGRIREARAVFEALARLSPQDSLIDFYLSRCEVPGDD